MKKRIFAVMLAALLSLSLLAGCKPSDTPDDDTTTTTTTAQGENDPLGGEETDPSGDDLTDPSGDDLTDPSGEEIVTTTDKDGKTQTTKKTQRTKTTKKTSGNNGSTVKATTTTKKSNQGSDNQTPATPDFTMPFDETMKWSLFMTEHSYQPIKDNSLKFDAIYELTNVELDIDVGESGSASTKLMAAAASGKMYDITFITNTQFRTYKTSLFYDITDRIKTDTPNYYKAVERDWDDLQLFSTGGRFYGFAQTEYNYLYDEQSVMCPQIRVDILENNNIKCPTTWKEWFEAMKVLKKKYPDSQPYASRSMPYILDYWTKMLGQAYNIYYNAEAVKWECGVLNASKFQSVLQFMKDCYDEGILDQNFDVSSDKNFQDLAVASLTFTTIDTGPPTAKANEILQKTDKNAMFVSVAPFASHLNGGKTTTWYWPQSLNFQSSYYISSQAHHIDELLFFMDWCYTDEGAFTNNYGRLHETYEINEKTGFPYVPEKVWKAKWPAGVASNTYPWMSEYGLNQLCFAPYMDNSPNIKDTSSWENDNSVKATYSDMHEWQVDGAAEFKKGYASKQLHISPDVAPEMTARYDTLQAYIRNQVIAFIKGTREMSEYSTFVNDLKSMGIQELLDACNA